MLKSFFIALALVALIFSCQQKPEFDPSSISVLYVGYHPGKPMPEKAPTSWTSQERFAKEYKTRMPAFMSYLKQYFNTVDSIDCREYTADLSAKYDVTIFDENVKPIKERVIHTDPETGAFLSMEPAIYLPDDYHHASLFIGHPARNLGSTLGSKLDWYCLCLDRHAHHTKLNHEIFKGPFEVNPTIENRPTPKPILKSWDGGDMPAEIPMWEVNTEGYHDEKGYRIGMVSRGWGFEDSPDAEVISSGVCDKQKTAVAIGRHGNHFLWGFAGSPDYMTDEAKQVFANAIVYTYKHKDDKFIAKKYNERIATKVYADELQFYTTEKSYQESVKFYKSWNADMTKRSNEIKEKQAKGDELNEEEKMMLGFRPQPILTREQYLQKNIGRNSWSKETGLDTVKIVNFLKENRPYFYSQPDGFYDLQVDEDAKSLGIANDDIKILDAAISLLEEGKDIEKAKRLLWRYTIEDFATANEWRAWFNKYKSEMFFTQSGGFVWLINDPDANPDVKPRKDDELVAKTKESKNELKLDEPTHAEPVSVGAILVEGEREGEKQVVIKTKIMEGYHIYAFVPAGEAYIKTEQGIELPKGVKLVGSWDKSSPAPYPGKDKIMIYKDQNTFKHKVKVDANVTKGTTIKCWLYYQCCNADICFPPKKKEIVLTL
ncbi:protein-disulfide reductase DsbD domain-containing protein [Saccharicrinis sp. GN24d3]|uniref:protein-disulfide reductase DsbD domain-containing protein n=1 Tax=Saccharicrinis sp. GN24d3 TaxID=3458416 RepID=UPI004036DBA4